LKILKLLGLQFKKFSLSLLSVEMDKDPDSAPNRQAQDVDPDPGEQAKNMKTNSPATISTS
jgi:hypothetical protein